MALQIGITKENLPLEHRVALVPAVVPKYNNLHVTLLMEKNAGVNACFLDKAYSDVEITPDRKKIWQTADVILTVQPPTLNEIALCKKSCVIVGLLAPNRHLKEVKAMRDHHLTCFAMEYLPRISRAQAMDVLSSQAVVSGYKSVLIAANLSNRFFPMLTTAAGTIRPARILVIGAGVAGLQAIATARRLGAIVEAYDVRPATKEQVESLGGQFIDTKVDASGVGGYARALSADETMRQQEILLEHVSKADVVICTANVPGGRAPVIITKAMVEAMRPGSVIVDLAAESGGNCELTQADNTYTSHDVIISGPLNVPSTVPTDASEMYARNLFEFTKLFVKEGQLSFDWNDPILSGSVITHGGEIKNEQIGKLIN